MRVQKSFKNNESTLFIIPTPIGNLSDITYRSVETLNNVDIVYCEDKRVTSRLFSHYDISTPLKLYHDHNSELAVPNIIKDLESGKNIGLVSDAGMPGISDPGFEVISALKDTKFNVCILPGPSAFNLGIVYSNFLNNQFSYYGFLPKKNNQKKEVLNDMINSGVTCVFYESTHKFLNTLKLIEEINEKVEIVVCRELTKIYEEYSEGMISEVLNFYENNPINGEFVIVIKAFERNIEVTEEVILEKLNFYKKKMSNKDAIKKICNEYNLKKNYVYELSIKE